MDVKEIIQLIVLISLALVVGSIGLQSRWRYIEEALRHPLAIARGVVAVNIVVPAAAVIAILLLPIDPAVKAGIVIMAVSPLAPFVPGKMIKAGAGTQLAIGLYVVLIVLAVVLVPATFAILSASFGVDVSLPVTVIGWFVITSVLMPLAAGMVIAAWLPDRAAGLAKAASLVGMLLLLPILILALARSGSQLLGLIGDGTLAAIVLTVACGLAAGHILGGPRPENRIALAMAATMRHPGIAALVVNRHFDDPAIMLAVILYLVVSIIMAGLYQSWARKRAAGSLSEEPAVVN